MVRAVKMKIRKLSPGAMPPEHMAAIVAGALAVTRKRLEFEFNLIEVSGQAVTQSSSWVAQGRTMLHESHVPRRQPQPMTLPAHAWPARRTA